MDISLHDRSREIYCRTADIKDIKKILNIHIQAFPDFFLTMMGPRFLYAMYRSFYLNKNKIFIVCVRNGEIIGFAVGTTPPHKKDYILALQCLPLFFIAIIDASLRRPTVIIKKIFRSFWNGYDIQKNRAVICSAILRSIAVQTDAKGTGVAANLINAFELLTFKNGIKHVALTTDAENNERARSFYAKQHYKIIDEFTQGKKRKMLLLRKSIKL